MDRRGSCVFLAAALLVLLAADPSHAQLTTFTDPAAGGADFGAGIAQGGERVGVGAPSDASSGVAAGAVHLFNPATGSLQGTIVGPPPQAAGDDFGAAVATAGPNLLVGAPGTTSGGVADAGIARLYDPLSASVLATFENPTPGDAFGNSFDDRFGAAVAGDGTLVAIGAPGAFGGALASGEAYVFDGDSSSDTFGDLLLTIPSVAPGIGPDFGAGVGLVGGDVIVGAPEVNVGTFLEPIIIGEAYLFDGQTGSLSATFENPFIPSEEPTITPPSYDSTEFGVSVAGVGNLVLIGSPGDGTTGSGGRAYVFDQSGTLIRTLQGPNPASGRFGASVAALGSHCLVGAPDNQAVYLFDCTSGALLDTFENPGAFAAFGRAVAGAGTGTVLAGAAGEAYRFAAASPDCGNGTLDPSEECDDGNGSSCDGCSAACAIEACGNGVVECAEQCDDGNADEGDCCLSNCTSPCECGNGLLDPGEDCDDGDTDPCDGCSSTCQFEFCGNGVVDCTEDCDDANGNGNDCCNNMCVDPCDDENSCTQDSCTVVGSGHDCDHENLPAGTPCASDGNDCTLDECSAQGGCRHKKTPMNGEPCTDDGNACTDDLCQGGNCTHPSEPNGTACPDDGSLCTGDECTAGVCTHPPVDCDDGNPCTLDTCESGTGLCDNQPVTDGLACQLDPCLQVGTCQAGSCVQSTPITCPTDGNPCTSDVCDTQQGGCIYPAKSPGSACDADSGGNDGNACTQDICDAASQCLHLCQSGLACGPCGAVCGGTQCTCGG